MRKLMLILLLFCIIFISACRTTDVIGQAYGLNSKSVSCGYDDMKGDINSDGMINGGDLELLKRVYLRKYSFTGEDIYCIDINEDGLITKQDYLILDNYVSNPDSQEGLYSMYNIGKNPFYIKNTCTDSDGLDFYNIGEVCVGDECHSDKCMDVRTIFELYCMDEITPDYETYVCPNGCNGGACVQEEPTTIMDNNEYSYRYAAFTCYDEFSQSIGSESSCKTYYQWKQIGDELCNNLCNSDRSKCGVSSASYELICDDDPITPPPEYFPKCYVDSDCNSGYMCQDGACIR